MPFSKLIGNDLVKVALTKMIEASCVPNTLLFYGPEGVGKSLFALQFAALLIEGKADSRSRVMSGTHPDIHRYSPEGKSGTHPVENMRHLVSEVILPPYEAPAQVFIIEEAHRMLPYSSNALLKTLEEPPPNTYFILLTNELDAMLPTIVSRSRKIAFFPIAQKALEAFIQQKWNKTEEEARRIAFLSHGSMARAEQLTLHRELAWRAPLLDLLTLHLPFDHPQFLKLALEIENGCLIPAEEEESASILPADALFEEIIAWYRDLELLRAGVSLEHLYHLERLEALKSFSLIRPSVPLEKVLDCAVHSRLALQRNIKLRTVLEHFFLALLTLRT